MNTLSRSHVPTVPIQNFQTTQNSRNDSINFILKLDVTKTRYYNRRFHNAPFFPIQNPLTFHSVALRARPRSHLEEISKFQERQGLINYLKSADAAWSEPECFFYTTGRLAGAKEAKEFIRESKNFGTWCFLLSLDRLHGKTTTLVTRNC